MSHTIHLGSMKRARPIAVQAHRNKHLGTPRSRMLQLSVCPLTPIHNKHKQRHVVQWYCCLLLWPILMILLIVLYCHRALLTTLTSECTLSNLPTRYTVVVSIGQTVLSGKDRYHHPQLRSIRIPASRPRSNTPWSNAALHNHVATISRVVLTTALLRCTAAVLYCCAATNLPDFPLPRSSLQEALTRNGASSPSA